MTLKKLYVRHGYRAFDTARDYGNENGVGKGIWNSDVERSDIYLTTKLPTAVKDYEGTKKAINEASDRFSLEYIDMLLIHSLQPWIEVNRTNDRHFEGNLENWRAMEEAVKAGKVRSIGVSNFLQEDIANIVNSGTIKPAVNQIEVHIGHVPTDFIMLPAQLMLAFDLQLGCIVLPKSDNVSEMKENVDIDFEISEEDMADLIKLKENTQAMSV